MKSNFSFLEERFGEYYKLAVEAEHVICLQLHARL
jgi:hypothetical protein